MRANEAYTQDARVSQIHGLKPEAPAAIGTAKEGAERVEKHISRQAEALLVMTKIGRAAAQLKLCPFKTRAKEFFSNP